MDPWQLQPARDTGLTPAERFRSVRRESGLLESFAHHACFSLLRTYFAIAHRLKITGREKLPARIAGRLCAKLSFSQIEEIMEEGVATYLENIRGECAEIHAAIHQIYFDYAIDAELAS